MQVQYSFYPSLLDGGIRLETIDLKRKVHSERVDSEIELLER
jgi:hypothetical protein